MADIFISHVEEDAQVALEIAQGLEAVGYTVWYYERDSVPGLSYLVQTGQAIEQSHAIDLPSAPAWWAWKGLAWDGRFLWVIHNETNKLYRVDPQICR
jgi:hypothetical protein